MPMSKQDIIRDILSNALQEAQANHNWWEVLPKLVKDLDKAGVVKKVDRAKPPIIFDKKFVIDSKLLAEIVEKVRDTYDIAGYLAVESLI